MSTSKPSAEIGAPNRPEVDPGRLDAVPVAPIVNDVDGYQGPEKRNKIRWQWNLPLLWLSLGLFITIGLGSFLLYRLQSNRVADGLRVLAETAREEGDFKREVKWLSQLLSLQPINKEVVVQLAIAVDRNSQGELEAENARRALLKGIAALDPEKDDQQLSTLRRSLIQRLIEMRGIWLAEAEKQVLELDATPAEAEPLHWLALAIYGQWESGEWRARDQGKYDAQKDYWRWIATQPVGLVVQEAYSKNPKSIELMVALATLCTEHPELFGETPDDAKKSQLLDQAKSILQSLKLDPSGRAQWASYVFGQRLEPQSATELIKVAAPSAYARLLPNSEAESSETKLSAEEQRLSDFWDTQLVMAYASLLGRQANYTEASEWYSKLISVEKERVPEVLVEQLFVNAGLALAEQGKTKEAIELLSQGCQRVGESQAIGLWDAWATYAYRFGSEVDVKKTLESLSKAVLARGEFLRMNRFEKAKQDAEQNQLNIVGWHADVLKAGYEIRFGSQVIATRLLSNALNTQMAIPSELRLEAIRLLAEVHSKGGLWELAARTLEEAVALFPNDKLLRRQTSDAWQRAGATGRAQEQLSLSDDGSFDAALTMLQMMMATENAQPPARRDPTRIRLWLDETAGRMQAETAAGNPPARAWLFETILVALKLNSPDASGSIPEPNAAEPIRDIFDLANRHPKVAQLQSMVTLALKAAGREDEAKVTLSNLAALQNEEPRWYLEAQLRLALQDKNTELVKNLIQEAIQSKTLPELDVRRLSSEVYESIGDLRQAVETILPSLQEISDTDRYRMGVLLSAILRGASDQGELDVNSSVEWKPEEILVKVIDALRRSEGEEGTRWKLLEVARFYQSFLKSKTVGDLEQGAKLLTQVLAIRPRWSDALTLSGDLAAVQGRADQAVDFYRRAINEGESRVATIFSLVQQLNRLGKFDEADAEFLRISGFSEQVSGISELAVGIAQRKGNFDQALDLARKATEARKNDPSAWLVLSQSALAKTNLMPGDAAELIAEAENALIEANRLTEGKDTNIWVFRLRFAARYRSPQLVKSVIDELAQSNLPVKTRAILAARAYSQLREFDLAKSILNTTIEKQPGDIELLAALADCHRDAGEPKETIQALERAFQVDPKREDVRRALALALVTSNPKSEEVAWDRVASLVGKSSSAGPSDTSQFFHAMLLATRGQAQQSEEALKLLQPLFDSKEADVGPNAVRLSASIRMKAWNELDSSKNVAQSHELVPELRRLCDRLISQSKPVASDIYSYGDFLLRANLLDEVPAMIEKLEAISPANTLTLDLRYRLAKAKGEVDQLPTLMAKWTQDGKAANLSEAGRMLAESGFSEQALPLLQQAYAADPNALRPLVVGLSRAERMDEAARLCVAEYNKRPSGETAALLIDLAIAAEGKLQLDASVEEIAKISLEKFANNAKLLELVGTLRLFQQKYEEAFELLTRSEVLAPKNLFTLNNLAMTAAEIKGKELVGLEKIQKAIELYGRIPDLLDTLGVVQMQCGMLDEAEKSLREAAKDSQDPRTKLHLIQLLEAKGQRSEIEQIFSEINLSDLEQMNLLAREQRSLEALTKEFRSNSPSKESL